MMSVLTLATAAWAQTAVHSYCSLDPLAPPMPPGAAGPCVCVRHPNPQGSYDHPSLPDWYADVTNPNTKSPSVQPDSCFDVTERTSGMSGWSQDEMEEVLGSMAHTIGHNRLPYAHHWHTDFLTDADQFPGCSPIALLEHPTVNGWQIRDGMGVIAGIVTNGQTVLRMIGRDPANARNDDIFVVLDTGEVWILPGPHPGGVTWNAAP